MQDFDTLRSRVEATAGRLAAVQSERRDQSQSLIELLRRLEERHAAQEQQLSWYRDRLAPLDQANRQLVGLIEQLLQLIEQGFGEESLVPLRNASVMASAMLADELQNGERGESGGASETWAVGLPEFSDAGGIAAEEEPADVEVPEAAGDLQMEEDALISFDDLLEIASSQADEASQGFDPAVAAARPDSATFEDVPAAWLERETEAEAASASDDLPDCVRRAASLAGGDVADMPDVAVEPAMAAFDAATGGTTGRAGSDVAAVAREDDLGALSAVAEALEADSGDEDAPTPAPSDIRALLLRVEALARKAEAMRAAQSGGNPMTGPAGRGRPRPAAKPSGAAA